MGGSLLIAIRVLQHEPCILPDKGIHCYLIQVKQKYNTQNTVWQLPAQIVSEPKLRIQRFSADDGNSAKDIMTAFCNPALDELWYCSE